MAMRGRDGSEGRGRGWLYSAAKLEGRCWDPRGAALRRVVWRAAAPACRMVPAVL
jgi:hypothetical protein